MVLTLLPFPTQKGQRWFCRLLFICLKCPLTIANARDEDDLAKHEKYRERYVKPIFLSTALVDSHNAI
jgi:hypothetical protein